VSFFLGLNSITDRRSNLRKLTHLYDKLKINSLSANIKKMYTLKTAQKVSFVVEHGSQMTIGHSAKKEQIK
jgi:hypothetical protein